MLSAAVLLFCVSASVAQNPINIGYHPQNVVIQRPQNNFLSNPQTSFNLQPESVLKPPSAVNELRFSGFDFQLLREFSKFGENVLISPLSIKTILAMVLEGAKGVCANEIQLALRIRGMEQSAARDYLTALLSELRRNQYLDIANSIFVSKKVRVIDSYRSTLQAAYKGVVENIDFTNVQQAVRYINDWVSAVTRGNIPSIISPENIYKDSVVVIANALYFKGKWKTPFDEQNTRPEPFFTPNGLQNVTMMQVTSNFKYNHVDELRADVVDLPYEDGFSMLIAMPSDSTNIENLAADMHGISSILEKLNTTELNLSVPKFELEYTRDLIDVLKPMGVKTIFTPEANLTGIVANDNVQVNKIIHKTKIQVDEQGTRAAAASGVFVIPLIGSTAHKVTINRPFIYFIYHIQTKSIIFEGIFRYPQQRTPTPNLQSRFNYY